MKYLDDANIKRKENNIVIQKIEEISKQIGISKESLQDDLEKYLNKIK